MMRAALTGFVVCFRFMYVLLSNKKNAKKKEVNKCVQPNLQNHNTFAMFNQGLIKLKMIRRIKQHIFYAPIIRFTFAVVNNLLRMITQLAKIEAVQFFILLLDGWPASVVSVLIRRS